MVSSTVFNFKGLPHISANYGGDKYVASRYKMKKAFEKLGSVKKLYVDMNTGSGKVTIENGENGDIVKVVEAICNSPTRMMKISWEQSFLKQESEQEWLLPYKAWLFLDVDGSFSEIKERCQERLDFEQMIHTLEYQKHLDETEFDDFCEEWLLQCELDEVLTSCYADTEDEVQESKKRTFETMILDFDSDDEDSDDEDSDDETQTEYQLVETFTPVSGKTDFTIEEICEHIRMLSVTGGKTELSVDKLTEYFGQKREYKKVPKRCVSPGIDGDGFVQRELPLHRRKVEDEPVVVKVDLNEVLDLEFPKLALN